MNEKEVSHPQLISISEVRGRGRAGNSSEPDHEDGTLPPEAMETEPIVWRS